ncbi:MAG: hypothetical protein NTV46_18320 [Verrucomicrobia bacterium]|nr:hypothetical protein [Verrucomicrobiota bacterium]
MTRRQDLSFRRNGILIAPAASSKLTLEESFAKMAMDSADLEIAREWAATGLTDGLEKDSGC